MGFPSSKSSSSFEVITNSTRVSAKVSLQELIAKQQGQPAAPLKPFFYHQGGVGFKGHPSDDDKNTS